MLLFWSPTPEVSNKPRLFAPRLTATVVNNEAKFLAPSFTVGSDTAALMNEVPKYTKVPAIAATRAYEKKDCRKITKPKSESPKTQKNRNTRPLFEYFKTLILRIPMTSPVIMVTTMK